MNFRRKLKETVISVAKEYIALAHKENHKLTNSNAIASDPFFSRINVDYTPDLELGHYATNAVMLLSQLLKNSEQKRKNQVEIAHEFKSLLMKKKEISSLIEKIEIAGPGFLNFYFKSEAFSFFFQKEYSLEKWLKSYFQVTDQDSSINNDENQNSPQSRRLHFEFVSANPTGPLNIVSARTAAVGDSITRVLKRTNHNVFREYYVNDFGNQVRLLGVSFGVRFLQSKGFEVEMPENSYQGEYIKDILSEILKKEKLPSFLTKIENTETSVIKDQKEIEELLEKAGDFFSSKAIHYIVESQKKDLTDFKVEFDCFFSERSLHEASQTDDNTKSNTDKVEESFQLIRKKRYAYENEGAFFFKSTEFGDDKDRVLKKKDGSSTYFLADIAYHIDKFSRGYTHVYDLWGPDHHGYIARLKGALQACGYTKEDSQGEPKKKFQVLIVQQVNLIEDGKPIVMSKRLGKFHTMRDLIEKIPVDVCRYFFASRSQSQHLDFDLQLALDQSQKNPVYYIQYAHARIHSIFRAVEENVIGLSFKTKNLSHLLNEWMPKGKRNILLFQLYKFANELEVISQNFEIHRLTVYLYETANCFTSFYHDKDNQIISLLRDKLNEEKIQEGLFLLKICQITADILKEGLSLLGISAPQKM